MNGELYRVEGDNMIINWKKLNDSKVLTQLELTLLYKILDKVEESKENK